MSNIGLLERAVNHVFYASGVGPNILGHSNNPVFQTTGYVISDLNFAEQILEQSNDDTDNVKIFDINGVIIPSPRLDHNLVRLFLDKNLLASIFPVITPTLASKIVDKGIYPLLKKEKVHNIVASASPSWLPWAGAVDQLLKEASGKNIQIFHSVHRNRNIPPVIKGHLDTLIDEFQNQGVTKINIDSFFDIKPYPEIMGTDMRDSSPWFGDGFFLNSVGHFFAERGITPTLRAFMVNNHIQKLGFEAAKVDVQNRRFEPKIF